VTFFFKENCQNLATNRQFFYKKEPFCDLKKLIGEIKAPKKKGM
jgi:hypothetical protein